MVGCTKVSPGCRNCYAETMAHRLQAMGTPGYQTGFRLTLLPERLKEPARRKRPTVYFVNSMSDLFHKGVPDIFVDRVIEVMRETPQHTYQILTKRAQRLAMYLCGKSVPGNAWFGVSVEDRQRALTRIPYLRMTDVAVRFLSVEPLLEDLGELDLSGIHWVIVGGESGPKARPMQEAWVNSIYRQCKAQNVPFFFKQWGVWGRDGVRRSKKKNGRTFRGAQWNEMPVTRRTIREAEV